MSKWMAICLITALVGGCAAVDRPPQRAAAQVSAPAAPSYVWARNDGRRMAADPVLRRQGEADQAECQASASAGGGLNMRAFVSCMEAKDYHQRSS